MLRFVLYGFICMLLFSGCDTLKGDKGDTGAQGTPAENATGIDTYYGVADVAANGNTRVNIVITAYQNMLIQAEYQAPASDHWVQILYKYYTETKTVSVSGGADGYLIRVTVTHSLTAPNLNTLIYGQGIDKEKGIRYNLKEVKYK